MRYAIDQRVPVMFIHVDRTTTGTTNPLFVPWTDRVKDLELKVLTVKEHHVVPTGWHHVKAVDGYVLTDNAGDVWHNQFPKVGHKTSRGEHLFRRHGLFDARPLEFESVAAYLQQVDGGIVGLGNHPKEAGMLRTHRKWLISEVERLLNVSVVPSNLDGVMSYSFLFR